MVLKGKETIEEGKKVGVGEEEMVVVEKGVEDEEEEEEGEAADKPGQR